MTGTRIWPACVVVGAQAALTQINDPASVALLPRVVRPDQLMVANAANSTSASLARLVGSPLGGLAVGLGGIRPVVAIDGATFLAVAIATAFVRADAAPITTDAHTGDVVHGGVRAAVRAIGERRSLRALLLVDGFGQLAQGFFVVLFVVFVVRRLGGGGVDVGIIRGSMAVGAIVSAAVIGRFAAGREPVSLLSIGYVGLGVISLVLWNAPTLTTDLWLYLLVFGASGIPGAAIEVGLFTTVQRSSPPGMLGRVVGVSNAINGVTRAAGSLLAGLLLTGRNLVLLLDAQATIYVVAGGLTFAFVRPHGRQTVPSAGRTRSVR